VNIREYYEKDGQLLPGRKGTYLTLSLSPICELSHGIKNSKTSLLFMFVIDS